jgi:hypothetical protein
MNAMLSPRNYGGRGLLPPSLRIRRHRSEMTFPAQATWLSRSLWHKQCQSKKHRGYLAVGIRSDVSRHLHLQLRSPLTAQFKEE